ncbi:MAG: hypothetical protein LH471_05850 [Salinibacterium sp.]|nr:hypothetical protein [Salinibacterium sp.]
MLLITSGLTFLRISGPASWWVDAVMALGVRAFADAEPLDDFESEVDTAEQLETPPVTNEG